MHHDDVIMTKYGFAVVGHFASVAYSKPKKQSAHRRGDAVAFYIASSTRNVADFRDGSYLTQRHRESDVSYESLSERMRDQRRKRIASHFAYFPYLLRACTDEKELFVLFCFFVIPFLLSCLPFLTEWIKGYRGWVTRC